MSKIRILIAHNDEIIKNEIVDSIRGLEFVEIVGITTEGNETFNKIIEEKPEMVFAKFDLSNMNGLDLMKKTVEKLENNIPIFNIIVDEISDDDLNAVVDVVGNKLNALVREPYGDRVINILEDYNDYKKSNF